MVGSCDDLVAVALPASRRRRQRSTTAFQFHRSGRAPSRSRSDQAERCWGCRTRDSAQSRTSGTTRRRVDDQSAWSGRSILAYRLRSRRSISTSDMFLSSLPIRSSANTLCTYAVVIHVTRDEVMVIEYEYLGAAVSVAVQVVELWRRGPTAPRVAPRADA